VEYTPPEGDDGGCGCRLTPRSPERLPAALLTLLGLGLLVQRRRHC